MSSKVGDRIGAAPKPNFGSKRRSGVSAGQLSASAPEVAANSDWVAVVAGASCWSQVGDSYFPVSDVTEALAPGAYRCLASPRGPYLQKMPIEIDSLLHLPDGAVEVLLAEFRKFWALREKFRDHGYTFKRGLLMWGPPGSGKTSAIWQMTQEIIAMNGVVLFVEDPALASACISVLRRIEPDRPMITVMEDLDALVQRHGEHGFLALLDGETQIANVVHVATTNYPQYLDRRFVDRPSRFDTVMHVGMPTAEARRVYIRSKEPTLDEAMVERWVKKTADYSIAHLREVIIATQCFGQSEDEVFKRLDEMREQHISSDGFEGDAGFMAKLLAAARNNDD